MDKWVRDIFARYREFIEHNPDMCCFRCGLVLSKHAAKQFMDCELVLATAGRETLLMNRPNG